MVDKKGNLITSSEGLENLALEHFKNVLENRQVKGEPKQVKQDKENFCKL